MPGTDMRYTAPTRQCPVLTYAASVIGDAQRPVPALRRPHASLQRGTYRPTPRNQIQETAITVQFVPGTWFPVFDFGMYPPLTPCPVLT
eukprot:1295864-Rhodomonas_salina.3